MGILEVFNASRKSVSILSIKCFPTTNVYIKTRFTCGNTLNLTLHEVLPRILLMSRIFYIQVVAVGAKHIGERAQPRAPHPNVEAIRLEDSGSANRDLEIRIEQLHQQHNADMAALRWEH